MIPQVEEDEAIPDNDYCGLCDDPLACEIRGACAISRRERPEGNQRGVDGGDGHRDPGLFRDR
jgi:hypothetical protein